MTKEIQKSGVKERLQALIKKHHKILTVGCGSSYCTDKGCVSSDYQPGQKEALDANTAVQEAVQKANAEANDLEYTGLNSHDILSMMTSSGQPLLPLLVPSIKTVFSDPALLSSSFLPKGCKLEESPNLQREQVEEVYTALFALDCGEVEEVLCDSMGALARKLNPSPLSALAAKFTSEKQGEIATEPSAKYLLNCVIVILLNPMVQSPEYAQGPFAEFCECVASLAMSVKVSLVHYMATLTPDILRTLVHNFQQVIAFSIAMIGEDCKLNDEDVACNGCACLQLVYAAVIYRSQHTLPTLLGSLSAQASVDQSISTSAGDQSSNTTSQSNIVEELGASVAAASAVIDGDSPPVESARLFFEEETASTLFQGYPSPYEIAPHQIIALRNTSSHSNLASPALIAPWETIALPPPPISTTPSPPLLYGAPGNQFTHVEEPSNAQPFTNSDQPSTSQHTHPGLITRPSLPSLLNPFLAIMRQMFGLAPNSEPENSIESIFSSLLSRKKSSSPRKFFKLVGIDPLWDCHTDVDLALFYNENISDEIKIEDDYINYKTGQGFSFLSYPFVLLPNIKSVGLLFDNKINMNNQIHPLQLFRSHPRSWMPFFKITVRRTHLIEDALLQLELVTEESPSHLQKQLFVEFDGEEGVDEGGVQKEFFQLVIAELFKPDYGMYIEIEDTKSLWFNPQSFEADSQYKLIGMILGLAVYNSVILDVRFPQVLYQKLMGGTPDVRDLILSHPSLGSSLQQMLDHPGDDVEEVFMCDYAVSTTGVFGETITADLIEGGPTVSVTNANRADFVARYVDYVLNKSVELQFDQFKKGFDMVTETSQLKDWFRPEELEKLIVGTQILDFHALEKAAHYDGGFDEDTPCVKWFWEVIHAMTEQDQSKFLSFSTGCNRAPIGGMAAMSFTIAKNGADSERLPCAHTCFNVILVPEYSSKEKLERKLYKSIQYFEGFGMI